MPGFIMHIAIAKEYLKKHHSIDNDKDFIEGNILPDLTDDKSKTHYGKSPTFTNLKEFLKYNRIDNALNKGKFLHLIADYMFYNVYLADVPRVESKEILHNDYDIINKELIDRYHIQVPEKIKGYSYYKKGKPKILTVDLAIKVIEEISNLNIEDVEREVKQNLEKWSKYKEI